MATEVLQNIHYFLGTVLLNAYNRANWTAESVNNTFFWAEYCEKICKNVVASPKASDFDHCIHSLGNSISNWFGPSICLEYLKHSVEELFKAFLENKHLDEQIFQFIINKGKEKKLDTAKLLDDAVEVKKLCSQLFDVLKPSDEILCMSVSYEVEADLLLEFAEQSILNLNTEQETEKWLCEFLHSLCCDGNKMLVLLYVLMKKTTNESSNSKLLHQYFFHWFIQRTKMDSCVFNTLIVIELFKQPSQILSKLASQEFLFYKNFIDILVKYTNMMVPIYEEKSLKWENKQTSLLSEISFTTVLSHFKSLCGEKGKVSKATRTLLQSLLRDNEASPIWREICFHVCV